MLQPTSSSSYLHQSSSSMAATEHRQSSSQPMPVQSTYSHQQVIRDSYIISFSKPYHTYQRIIFFYTLAYNLRLADKKSFIFIVILSQRGHYLLTYQVLGFEYIYMFLVVKLINKLKFLSVCLLKLCVRNIFFSRLRFKIVSNLITYLIHQSTDQAIKNI